MNSGNTHEFEKQHPCQEDEDQQDIPLHGYTYMKWPFGEGRTLLTRSQVHSYVPKSQDEIEYTNIYALNQWKYVKGAWKEIDSDKTAILSQELTDNANRVSKWAIQSMLAGADSMKIAFVSRQKPTNNKRHAIMGTNTMTTKNFIDLIGFKPENAWNNVKFIVDLFENKEDGEYILIKDPLKNCLKVFSTEEEEEADGFNQGEGDAE